MHVSYPVDLLFYQKSLFFATQKKKKTLGFRTFGKKSIF